jgi:hypothetical protein
MGWTVFLWLHLGSCLAINTVDLSEDVRYIQRHRHSAISFTSCRGILSHNEEEYNDSNWDDQDPVRHIDRLPQNVRQLGVPSCCPSHGFLEKAWCQGRDRNGESAYFDNVEVCAEVCA